MADIAIASTLLNKLIGKMVEEVDLFHEVEDRVWSLLCMLKRLRPSVMEVERKKSTETKGLMWEFLEIVYEAHNAVDSYVIITTPIRGAEGISASSKEVTLKAAGDELRSQIECIKLRLKIWHKCFLNSTTASSSYVVEEVDEDDMVVAGLLENEVTMMVEHLKDKDPRLDVIPIVGPEGVGKTTLARRVYNHSIIVENFPCRAWIYAYELPLKELLQEIIKQVSHSSPHPSVALERVVAAAEDKDQHREKMIIGDLAIQTYKRLKNSERYLLVFDDVCRTQFWDDINMIFPNINKLGGGGGGGRIIFTTRYDEVALSARPRRPPFYLPPIHLNKEESWALFSMKVASSSRDKASTSTSSTSSRGRGPPPPAHSQQLEPDISPWKEWVDLCGGLPHAIVALAAKYHQNRNLSPADPNYEARLYLGLIYNYNLPLHLKTCFLYLGVLGGSCRFKQLKELIIAEGLVVPPPPRWRRTTMTRSQKTAAEVVKDDDDILVSAEEYVNELINRKLVKVVSKRWDGSVDEIRISSTEWIAFCRDKAREVNFRQLCSSESETTTFPDQLVLNIPQLCFHTAGNTTTTTTSPSKACSFLILPISEERRFSVRHWDFLLKTNYFSHLRVLDLFGVYLTDDIPSEISRLIHLRYLRLNFNMVGDIKLPQSICNLCNLQFLRVKNNYDYIMSRDSEIRLERFWEMRQLKQLLIGITNVLILPQPPPDDHDQNEDYLAAAATGGSSSSGSNIAAGGVGGQGLVTGGVVLHNLQRLEHVNVNCCTKQVLSRMPNLVTLGVGGYIEQRHIDNELSNSLPLLKRLQKLKLEGSIYTIDITLPRRWEVLFPPNITHLTLRGTELVGDPNPMGILGKLPNLKVLKLGLYAIDGDVLDVGSTAAGGVTTTTTTTTNEEEEEEEGCYDGGFRQLKCLKLDDLRIRRWNMSVGAMPSLEILVIRDCLFLEGLPSEALQNIHTLRELALEKVNDYSDPSDEEAALRNQEALEVAAVAIQEFVGKDRLQLRFINKPSKSVGGDQVATDAVTQSG